MKSAQSPTIDFNQMLVVSVFFHFLLFTTFMFLPETQKVVKRIKPAFMVSLISIPAGPPEVKPVPPVKQAPVAPDPVVKPEPKPVVQSKPEPKPEPKPIPVPPKPAASKALVSKLDELARLEKQKTIPKKEKSALAVPKPKESVLEDFENMKMKTKAEKKPVRTKIAKNDLTLKELEFEQLSRKSANSQSQSKPEKKSSLLKELDELERLSQQTRAALSKPKIKRTDPKTSKLVKQLESIQQSRVQIKVDTSKLSSRHSQKFNSEIRSFKTANMQKRTAPSASGETGDPGADALSLYLGEVQIKINEQWKNPAGGGTGKVQVSFKVFPNGKIETPKIVKSSRVRKLDNLALLAVKNAVLPPFPKEIREPNLPFIFEFTYEISKK